MPITEGRKRLFLILIAIACLAALETGIRIVEVTEDEVATTFVDIHATNHYPPYEWHPYLGRTSRKNHVGPTVRTDSNGFRSETEVPVEKPQGRKRLFIIGGSTAVGMGAPDGQTITDHLRRLIQEDHPEIDVINAANSGFNSSQELVQCALALKPFAPDLVVAINGRNDFHQATRPTWEPHVNPRSRQFADWYDALQKSKVESRKPDFFETLIYDIKTLARCSHAVRKLSDSMKTPPVKSPAAESGPPVDVKSNIGHAARIYIDNLELTSGVLEQLGCRYVAVLQPNLAASGKKLSRAERDVLSRLTAGELFYSKDHLELIADFHGHLAPPIVRKRLFDTNAIFDEIGPEETVFIDDCHLTPRGQEILATWIYGEIRATHLGGLTRN